MESYKMHVELRIVLSLALLSFNLLPLRPVLQFLRHPLSAVEFVLVELSSVEEIYVVLRKDLNSHVVVDFLSFEIVAIFVDVFFVALFEGSVKASELEQFVRRHLLD